MSAQPSKKRKLDSAPKSRTPQSKKARRQQAYTSDSSSGDEETTVTARDAPVSDARGSKQNTKSTVVKSSNSRGSGVDATRPAQLASGPLGGHTQETAGGASILQESGEPESEGEESQDSEESEDQGVSLGSSSRESGSEEESDSDADDGTEASSDLETTESTSTKKKPKRHDPSVFANSLSAILSSNLSRPKRSDPVLSRSKEAAEASQALADSKLEIKARRKLREDKRIASEKGRVKDVLLGDTKPRLLDTASRGGDTVSGPDAGQSAAEISVQERRLRKTAQRGVVKLFNAVRAAQVKAEEGAKKAREGGVVGMQKRDEKIEQMGRNAFLELVGAGGSRK